MGYDLTWQYPVFFVLAVIAGIGVFYLIMVSVYKPEPPPKWQCKLCGAKFKGKDQDAYWLKVGAAFAHRDRDGMNIVLQALPTSGRLVLRRFQEKEKKDEKRL